MSDLVGPYEIEVLLDVPTSEMTEIIEDDGFPAPVVQRGLHHEVRLWHRDDVLAWWSGQDDEGGGMLSDVIAASKEAVAGADELMTAKAVSELLGWNSPSTPWDLAKKGTFPAPVRSHGRTKLWDRREVEHWGRTAPKRRRRRK